MYRELQRWALLISLAVFVFTILAAFVPQWIKIQPYTRAYGLRSMCLPGGYCGAINYAELFTHPECKNGCFSTSLISRFHAAEAFMWIAAASLLLNLVTIASGFHRDLLHTARVMGPAVFFSTLAVISYVITLAVFGSTLRLHSHSYNCPFVEGCLYWGASSIVAFVALGLAFIAWLFVVVSILTRSARQRGVLLAWAFLVSVAALAFTLGSVLSSYWLYRSLPFSNLENGISIGPLNTCANGNCGATDQTWLLISSCKNVTFNQTVALIAQNWRNGLRGRFGVGVAFLSVAIITSLLVFFFAFRNWPLRTFIALLLTQSFLIPGTAVLGDTFDWWLGCGVGSYCDYITLTFGLDCSWGFAFAAAVVANLLNAILIAAWIIMWACRREDRAPDTTQVAVTTIAQPPAVPVGPRGAAPLPRA